MYKKYTYKTFQTSDLARQRINAKQIDYALLNAAIFYMTNVERVKKGLPVFTHSNSLEQAARSHSADMVKYNFLSHISKVKGKKSVKDRLEQVNITRTAIGENIAVQFLLELESNEPFYSPSVNKNGTFSKEYRGKAIPNHTYLNCAKSLVKRWMNSPPHRANILDRDFNYLGCGAILEEPKKQDSIPSFKATQNFCGQTTH